MRFLCGLELAVVGKSILHEIFFELDDDPVYSQILLLGVFRWIFYVVWQIGAKYKK